MSTLAFGKKVLIYYTPVLFWGIFISVATLTPGNQLPMVLHDINDKLIHAAIFFVAALLIIAGQLRYNWRASLRLWQAWTTWWLTLLHGALIELGQHFFVPGRYGDWYDLLYDVLGSTAAIALWYIFQALRRKA